MVSDGSTCTPYIEGGADVTLLAEVRGGRRSIVPAHYNVSYIVSTNQSPRLRIPKWRKQRLQLLGSESAPWLGFQKFTTIMNERKCAFHLNHLVDF